jgi:hypothetical protein
LFAVVLGLAVSFYHCFYFIQSVLQSAERLVVSRQLLKLSFGGLVPLVFGQGNPAR